MRPGWVLVFGCVWGGLWSGCSADAGSPASSSLPAVDEQPSPQAEASGGVAVPEGTGGEVVPDATGGVPVPGTSGSAAGQGSASGTATAGMMGSAQPSGVASVDPASAEPAASPEPEAEVAEESAPGASFPAVTDFEQAGPFTGQILQNVGPDGFYTVYLPEGLPPEGVKNPLVGWMSGGSTSHESYTLLPHLASHGFVVIAANSVPGIGQEVQLGQQILRGLEWAIAENSREGSEFFEQLDVEHVASMGYSMGSLATFTIADESILTTTVHISGGNMIPERIELLKAPAAFICGIPGPPTCGLLDATCDIAATNCNTDFESSSTPVFYANFDGGHLGILTPPLAGQISELVTAWLRYQLMEDTSLRARFVGDDCAYCSDSRWKVQQKLLP